MLVCIHVCVCERESVCECVSVCVINSLLRPKA